MRLDIALLNAVHGLSGRNRLLDRAGFFLAHWLTFGLAGGILIFLFTAVPSGWTRAFAGLEILVTFVLSRGLAVPAIHHMVRRPRPFEALGFEPVFRPLTRWAFPSGHMTSLFALATVMFAWSPPWGLAYFALSALVGLGRLFAGVHWPSDLVVGALLGLVCGSLTRILLTGF